MKLAYIDKKFQTEWESLVADNPASGFMQSFWWAEFCNQIGWETFKIGMWEGDKLRGGMIVYKYRNYESFSTLYIPQGPVIDYQSQAAEEMFEWLVSEVDAVCEVKGDKQTANLSIEPKLDSVPKYFSRFRKAKMDREPIRSQITELLASEEKILSIMKPKTRYNIRLATRRGVEVKFGKPAEGLADFWQLYTASSTIPATEKKESSYFEALVGTTNSGEAEIANAYYKGKAVATAWILYFGGTATYLYGATADHDLDTMPVYLLHYEIIKHAKKLGYKRYDWYGLSPVDSGHPWDGFSTFKRKFGGSLESYIGAYDFVYNARLYNKYLSA